MTRALPQANRHFTVPVNAATFTVSVKHNGVRVEITFSSAKVEQLLATEAARVRALGPEAARLVYRRMVQLHAASDLAAMATLPGRCHELFGDRDGQLAVEVTKGLRLVFTPTDQPPPRKPDGGLDWSAVTAITILEVTDYHG